jgi:hypothetical protein
MISHFGSKYPKVPYIVKLNSKSNLVSDSQQDPYSMSWYDVRQVISFIKNSKLNIPADVVGNNHPWYLRVRSFGVEKAEISWKSLPTIVGNTRHSDEITVPVSDFQTAKSILDALGLKNYAHQEKDRLSFQYQDWNFDIDQYPNMPCYLEIEGTSHQHVNEAIKLLNLETHESISEGERRLIEEKYKLNWSDMRF